MTNYRQYVASRPLTEALWWFIENVSDDTPERTEIFFDLRERCRDSPSESSLARALKSLISDIEAMQPHNDPNNYWFGPFSESMPTGSYDEETNIKWPNLAIDLEEAKIALKEYEND